MAIASRGTANTNINTSTASTTITWNAPNTQSDIAARDIWILSASFRAGTGVTITGVPATFNLIQRIDQGAGATVDTSVIYWYLATGAEAAGASVGTITLSASSKYVTITTPLSGVDTTNPVSGAIVTGTGTTAATTGTLAASDVGSGVCVIAGYQSLSASQAAPTGSISGAGWSSVGPSNATTGGSGATNVSHVAGFGFGAIPSQTYTSTTTASATATAIGFVLAAPALGKPVRYAPIPFIRR